MATMYATKYEPDKMARAQSVSLPLSFKQSVEICSFIRHRPYQSAVRLLEQVLTYEAAVPYTKFNRGGTGHRKGIGPGRYPIKASTAVLKLLKSAYANAGQKGLNQDSLVIKAAVAKQGPKAMRYGRKRGLQAKRTHIEIVLMQTAKAPEKAARKAEKKKAPEAQKAEAK